MPRTCTLVLTPRQRRALARVRDRSPAAHLREKAAALLKVADGWRVRDVARLGPLRLLAGAVGWLAALTPAGVHRLLARLGLTYRRGQEHLRSPDPEYEAKLAAVRRAAAAARRPGGKAVLVYLDEVTYYRRPSVA